MPLISSQRGSYPADTSPLLPVARPDAKEAGYRPYGSSRGQHSKRTSVTTRIDNAPSFTRTAMTFLVVLAFYVYLVLHARDVHARSISAETLELAPAEIQNSWGAYTPYFPVNGYVAPPDNCKVTQVNVIQRHGARFPTLGATDRIRAAVEKLVSASPFGDPMLASLAEYSYSLGVSELVPFGAYQSAESGAVTYERYQELISKGNIPFVRASGSDRVIDSATNWTAGFAEASNNIYLPKLTLILPEYLNDTLENAMCPAVGTSEEQTAAWTNVFAPAIADRLNVQAPGANLLPADIPSLMALCAFETVAIETMSPWCNLFTAEEFALYEYWSDLDKFYGTGYGQRLGPIQGVGYINELLARLTGRPVNDGTQTNRTLDADPTTFPLDRTIYADFSHDNLIIAVYAAMGLFKQPTPPDPRLPDPERTWLTSRLVPFSGRMVVERMYCKNKNERRRRDLDDESVKRKRRGSTYVRVLVNDAVQPLEFCGADEKGLCLLEDFVESQSYARNNGNGDFERCYEGTNV